MGWGWLDFVFPEIFQHFNFLLIRYLILMYGIVDVNVFLLSVHIDDNAVH